MNYTNLNFGVISPREGMLGGGIIIPREGGK